MKTRILERKDVDRVTVDRAEIVERAGSSLVLRSTAITRTKVRNLTADPGRLNQRIAFVDGAPVTGRIRLDLVAANILRVRYAEGEAVPENLTPLLAGELPAGARVDFAAPKPGLVEMATGRMQVLIHLDPYRLEIEDLDGRPLCGIGGSEKNCFHNWDSYNTGLCRAGGDVLAVESFDLAHDECIYGFGEKFGRLNKVGQTLDLDMDDAQGTTTPRSYKNVPFFVSTKGYGVFFNHTCRMTFWVGSMSAVDLQAGLEDGFLDYFVIVGDIKEVLAGYTALTGRGAVPPRWSFGYWQSRCTYGSAQQALTVARELRAREVPCDVIHLDTYWFDRDWYCDLEFSRERFPDPAGFIRELASMGFKLSLWQLPYLPEGTDLFERIRAVDGFVKDGSGGIYDVGITFVSGFQGIVGVIDFTNPTAVQVYQEALRKLLRLGAGVIKTDFGEEAPDDGVYHDGTPGRLMHNLYPLLYNKAVFEVTRDETGAGIVWARAAWAGSQRYPLHWGGDSTSNFANMPPQLAGGLSLGLSGFQFWSQDIAGSSGGFDETLFIRWLQMGLFLSHSRVHGGDDREIYRFGPETFRICRDYIRLRYRLLPYLYGSAVKCVKESLPMARALVVEYQDDPTARQVDDQYLLGDSLLVAPVMTRENRRRVYLPKSYWTDWWTGERIPGGRWLDVEAPLDTLPLYIKEGGLIPLGPVMNYVDERPTDRIELLVALFAQDGRNKFLVPVDGAEIEVAYTSENGRHTITIAPSPVDVEVRTFGPGEVRVIRD